MLNDELGDLAIFAAVARPAASRGHGQAGKSQSALSQSVRRLEERLKLLYSRAPHPNLMPTLRRAAL